jgi:uncharacterized protein (TIGR02001 family)
MAVSRSVAALCGSAGVALIALSGAAAAEELTWSATLTGTSDYVFRGISQTDNDPTIQGSLTFSYGMFYAGAWASGLDWGDVTPDAQLEVDWYAGIKPTWESSPLGPVTFDFGVIYYTYPGVPDPVFETDYVEFKAGYSVSSIFIKNLTTGGTVYYSPEYSLEVGEVWTTESTASYALPKIWIFDPTISGLLGWQKGESSDSYNFGGDDEYYYWNAGLTLAVEKLTFDFRYWDSDLDTTEAGLCLASTLQCDERFVFSATVALP